MCIDASCKYMDLIDTQWNVNPYTPIINQKEHTRFNRYIVECKQMGMYLQGRISARFNRYIVECKLLNRRVLSGPYNDLIDTQWNVNDGYVLIGSDFSQDLIDTQWNVNSITSSTQFSVLSDLIDTQWNVNDDTVKICYGNEKI